MTLSELILLSVVLCPPAETTESDVIVASIKSVSVGDEGVLQCGLLATLSFTPAVSPSNTAPQSALATSHQPVHIMWLCCPYAAQ